MANIAKFNSRVVMKHDTEAAWNAAKNFIPLEGEIIIYTDLNKMKIGNGVDKVSVLPFSKVDLPIAISEGVDSIICNDLTQNTAYGIYSFACGVATTADGDCSHAEGYNSHAEGYSAHAEGYSTHAEGHYSHAEGIGSHAEGYCSHAEGWGSHAEGDNSHAEGENTTASGKSSHAEGLETQAIGSYSHASGQGTRAVAQAQFALGRYNIEDPMATLVVGVGSADNRQNAFTAGNDGTNHYITIGTETLTEEKLKSIKEGGVGAQIITWEDND